MSPIDMINEGNEMLIVGQVNDESERIQVRFIAQVFAIEERFRFLARQQRKK